MPSQRQPGSVQSSPESDAITVVRRQFEAVNRGDAAAALEALSEDVDLLVSSSFLDSGTYRGVEGVSGWFLNWFASFEPGYRFELGEVTELGAAVVVVAEHHGSGRSSGIPIEGRTFNAYWVRDGKIVRIELHTTAEDARAAVERSA
jgi:ketosteroid isomerase-like protein